MLQNYDAPGFADDAMHRFFVVDFDRWRARTADPVERFGVKPPVAPADQGAPIFLRRGFLLRHPGLDPGSR